MKKNQKIKTAEGNHAKKSMTVVFCSAAYYFAAACRFLPLWEVGINSLGKPQRGLIFIATGLNPWCKIGLL